MAFPLASSNIVAQAFRFMELRPVSSLADDSPQALAAAEQYPEALDLMLESHDWSFARRLVELSPTETLPAGTAADPDLAGLFTLPGDLLKLRRVWPDGVAWRLDARILRADWTDALSVLYTARQSDESRLPASFRTAVSLQLAVRLAPEWVSARTKRATLQDDLAQAVQAAIRADIRTASHARLDGRMAQPDWATEAVT